MGDMVFINPVDQTAQVILADGDGEIEDVVIYCDLCNQPLAISSKLGCDDVYIQCLKCHAVSTADLKIQLEHPEDHD